MLFYHGVFVISCFEQFYVEKFGFHSHCALCVESRSDLFPTSAAERTQDPCQTVPKWFDYHLGYRHYRICDHFPMDRSRCVLISRVLFPARPKKVKKKSPFLCHHVSCWLPTAISPSISALELGVLLFVLATNTAVGFFQEWKSARTMASLRGMSAPAARVRYSLGKMRPLTC
jgi:hypothetical protein